MHIRMMLNLLCAALLMSLVCCAVAEDTCVPVTTTIVEIPAPKTVTVTLKDYIKSTITVIAPSAASTTEQTNGAVPISDDDPTSQNSNQYDQQYASTVYNTIVKTVIVEEEQPTAQAGPLSFIVIQGTTSWLGETPTAGESLVVATSVAVITIVPKPIFDTTAALEPTTTRQSTYTSTITILKSATYIASPSGIFTGQPTGGWNTTSIATDSPETSILEALATTTYPTTSLPSLISASDFQKYTTLDFPTLTSTLGGSTTAVVNGQTLSWTSAPATYTSSNGFLAASTPSTLFTSTTLNSTFRNTASSSDIPATSTVAESLIGTSSSASVAPSSTACGITGDFTLNFDDIPPLTIGNQDVEEIGPLPLFNPYHKFIFSDGFTVVPPPRVPYLPSSKPLLLEFIPNFAINKSNVISGPNSRENGWAGDIGTADEGRTNCFNFNLYGASLGCDSRAADCVYTFSGYRYDESNIILNQAISQTIVVPACPQLSECPLTTVSLNGFTGLDSVRIKLTVDGLPKIWWIDDIRMGWFDNSCGTGVCRQTTKLPKGLWGLKV